MAPRAAYIHVPFCRHHCGYCNFTVLAGRDDLAEAYLEALAQELSWLGSPREIDTLFLGGGTPTHLPLEQLDRLMQLVLHWFPLAETPELTIEANPEDISLSKIDLLARHNVTRLSLGAQSFDSSKLNLLERAHTASDIENACRLARSKFASVSLDLIFGVPGESIQVWQADLERAVELGVQHISTYGLTFEKGTTFWNRLQHGDLVRVDEELDRQLYELAIDYLTARGFKHYEVSNFARPGYTSRHNLNYWLGGEYFAAGPGAARHLDGRRESNHRSTTTYLRRIQAGQSPVAEVESLAAEDRARERFVFGLRVIEGVDRDVFETQTGCSIEALFGPQLQEMADQGWITMTSQRIRFTRAGMLVSDSLLHRLL